jgi:hypothetical protein
MPTYLVRTIDDHDLVGIFSASNFDDLIVLVDECLYPADCEYRRLKAGGIMWTSPAIPIPIEVSTDETDEPEPDDLPWAGASLSDSWWDSFYGSSSVKWRQFFPDQPRQPRPAAPPRPLGPGKVLQYRKRI